MGGLATPYVGSTRRSLTGLGLAESSARLLPPQSVILSSRAPIGHLVINTVPMATNQGCKGLVPSEAVDHKYLFYSLMSIVRELDALGSGATFRELSSEKLRRVKIQLPNVPEQRRIVGILDRALEGISLASANASKSLATAESVLGHVLSDAFVGDGVGWSVTRLGEQFEFQRGFDVTKSHQRAGRVPVVSSGGIKSFHDTAMVKGPGVVIGRKGTLGKVFYLADDFWPHDTTLWVKDFHGNHPRLVYYFLRGLDVAHLDSGAANPALNRNSLHPLPILWPSRSLQDGLVAKLEAVERATQDLQSLYRRKIAALDELKQSLLHQAFSGNL
jgi:type I restriction enzyme S subunit